MPSSAPPTLLGFFILCLGSDKGKGAYISCVRFTLLHTNRHYCGAPIFNEETDREFSKDRKDDIEVKTRQKVV